MMTPDDRVEEYIEWMKREMEECVPNDSDCSYCPNARFCERIKK